MFTAILKNRLVKYFNENNIIPETRAGFREKRSTRDDVFILHSLIKKKLAIKAEKLFVLFIDFKTAFPSIKHSILCEKLAKCGVSNSFIRLCQSLYQKATMQIRNGQEITEEVEATEVVFQGETFQGGTLKWIENVMSMDDSRLPKVCMDRMIKNYNYNERKNNWLRNVLEILEYKINEENVQESIVQLIKNQNDILMKYESKKKQINIERYNNNPPSYWR